MNTLAGLEDSFDDELAQAVLNVSIDKSVEPLEFVAKSLYNFDLESTEGIQRLLGLLPVLDPEIIDAVYQDIFPGYPTETLAPRMARLELRGYLMDYLYDQAPTVASSGAIGDPEAVIPEEERSPEEEAGGGSPAQLEDGEPETGA